MRRRDVIRTAAGLAVAGASPIPALAGEVAGWTMPAKGEVTMIENSWVPMPDGVKLAVQLWLPADSRRRPAPIVLEYIPYRKRDSYRAFDMYWGATLAAWGIAYARLETRGSGDSTGILADEYLPSEQHDAATAIAWLAAQPWCNGSVGMRGVSWGGFSTLQAAALRPPALKAIMPMSASDMRYTDDAHYVGGVFALTGLKWAASMKVVMAGPPDPLISGDAWKEEWRGRLAATPPIAARWLSHQTNDAYWRQGSVALDWGSIACPVYVVGGLVDSYGNEIPRLLANLKVPRKGLYGPWQHGYPSPATPGPALDWAFEEVRWWRHWLMGEETGIMEEPMLRVFMPDATAAQVAPGPIPGRWVAETAWPSARCRARPFFLGASGLHDTPQAAESVTCSGARVVGLGKVEWVPFAPTELPHDQSPDDAKSLVFDTPPLAAPVEILGAGALKVRVASEQAIAHIAVRICEVTPDGRSWLVTYGLLNLTHRESHQDPSPLDPGRVYDVEIPLNFTSHRFPAGSRIRAAISESLWPLVWPSPQVATLTLDLGASRLDLPVRDPPAKEAAMPIPLAAPLPSDPKGWPKMETSEAGDEVRVTETWPDASSEITEIGETKSSGGPNVALGMTKGDPLSCVWKAEQHAGFARAGWVVNVKSEITISATATDFHVDERLVATLNGEVVADTPHTSVVRRMAM
ncbi:MAG TPA: CocE/NonD family hydrolase [Caulobacteraceae bacterium]|nr:CocE/NonD family hydrolase [Caulobacteraceae bacterium]